jgi:hypothetical protein
MERAGRQSVGLVALSPHWREETSQSFLQRSLPTSWAWPVRLLGSISNHRAKVRMAVMERSSVRPVRKTSIQGRTDAALRGRDQERRRGSGELGLAVN